uniref:Pco067871 n=1 Tax=Arundo donax TaxID=35708 RepID=A0A0A9EZE5_ARUDO
MFYFHHWRHCVRWRKLVSATRQSNPCVVLEHR